MMRMTHPVSPSITTHMVPSPPPFIAKEANEKKLQNDKQLFGAKFSNQPVIKLTVASIRREGHIVEKLSEQTNKI